MITSTKSEILTDCDAENGGYKANIHFRVVSFGCFETTVSEDSRFLETKILSFQK